MKTKVLFGDGEKKSPQSKVKLELILGRRKNSLWKKLVFKTKVKVKYFKEYRKRSVKAETSTNTDLV